jgi:hypothetical protein
MNCLRLSTLPHTWFIDIDGTIFQHNGHKFGQDVPLPGVLELWGKIPAEDKIVLVTARKKSEYDATVGALEKYGIRFDTIIFEVPTGERILINDRKPSGLATAMAINVNRDVGLSDLQILIDPSR